MHRVLLVLALAGLSACATAPAVGSAYHLDPDAGKQCQANCETLGMSLDAVVVMANSTGCVCTPRASAERSRTVAGASAAGGAITVFMQARQRQEQQRHDSKP